MILLRQLLYKCLMGFAISLATTVSYAETITVAAPVFSPFFTESSDKGIFEKLLDEAFELIPGVDYKMVYLPFNRVPVHFNQKKVDAAANIFRLDEVNKGAFISKPFFRYKDCFFALKETKMFGDDYNFGGLTLITYTGATVFQGERFKKAAVSAKEYKEIVKVDKLGYYVGKKRYDYGMGDIFIFYDSLEKYGKGTLHPSQFKLTCSFGQMFSMMGFHSESLRDKFNKAADELVKNGTYAKVFQDYKDKYLDQK
ncbi:transporter substrate-binding domain-containing protein [bacterium]|nr:transporter substrate-binding domain-containing protein [bacterium]